jgi:hypothetical protein
VKDDDDDKDDVTCTEEGYDYRDEYHTFRVGLLDNFYHHCSYYHYSYFRFYFVYVFPQTMMRTTISVVLERRMVVPFSCVVRRDSRDG